MSRKDTRIRRKRLIRENIFFISHHSLVKDYNENAYNEETIKIFSDPLSSYFFCGNYITKDTCKFSNLHCKFINKPFPIFPTIFINETYLIIPPDCPLAKNRNIYKKFEIIQKETIS